MDPEEWEQMVTISFDWEGDPKPVSTSFVGTYVKASLSLTTTSLSMVQFTECESMVQAH